MNKYNSCFKNWVYVLISVCVLSIIFGIWFTISKYDWTNFRDRISWQDSIKDIIIPMFCALVGAFISLAMDNSLSNEKLKIVLERLAWRWQYRCENKKWKKVNWYTSDWYDKEYKFIVKNRWKSEKELIKIMKKDDYWRSKYIAETGGKKIEEDYYKNWIKDHFIY